MTDVAARSRAAAVGSLNPPQLGFETCGGNMTGQPAVHRTVKAKPADLPLGRASRTSRSSRRASYRLLPDVPYRPTQWFLAE